jgi:hypothetical protein
LAIGGGVTSVVGVTSHGDPAYVQGATYMRVDVFLDSFITPTLAAYAEGSAPTGARCLFPEQCMRGASTCVAAPDDPSVSYCTAPCGVDADCPSPMVCVEVGAVQAQCRYVPPTPGTYGAACASDADGAEGVCTPTGVCALRCVPDGTSCPSGFACTNTEAIDFSCIASPGGAACAIASAAGRPGALAWLLAGALALRGARRSRRRARREP